MAKPRDDSTTEELSSRQIAPQRAPGLAVVFENGRSALRVFEVGSDRTTIGRGSVARVFIDDDTLSRVHCAVSFLPDVGWRIEDQSRNGSFVDGVSVEQRVIEVAEPRTLRIGRSVLTFEPEVATLMGQKVERRGDFVVGPVLRAVEQEIVAAARAGGDLLVTGETGTGKEWAAAAYRTARKQKGPEINVNSAALPKHLFESEVFGYVRGAFSGAERDAPGLFEAASGGTLFFDEIGDLPLDLQPKLLRVLQERTIRRVGEARERNVDVSFIAATNRDLRTEVDRGSFREDLFYRLERASVRLPPLRERTEDLPVIVEMFLNQLGAPPPSASLVDEVLLRPWRGNFRELSSAVAAAAKNALAASATGTDAKHMAARAASAGAMSIPTPTASEPSFRRTLGAAQIREALRAQDGNISAAARALGVHRHTLRRYMIRHGFPTD